MEVTYIYGTPGTGKTRFIFEKYNPRDICRITNYPRGGGAHFDAYRGQDVLVFEEFASQIPLSDMLNYLDIYPITLPARYTGRTACYNYVYVTSNLPFSSQFYIFTVPISRLFESYPSNFLGTMMGIKRVYIKIIYIAL